LKPKKVKNVSTALLDGTVGRIHMERQDLAKLQLKRTKAGKADRKAGRGAAGGAGDASTGGEEEEEEDDDEVGGGVGSDADTGDDDGVAAAPVGKRARRVAAEDD
jgi:hypothetical protein